MYSYTLRQDKVRSFLNKCVNYYKKHLLNTVNYSVGNPTHRYYNYMSFNPQTNSAIFEDSKFYSNKTFDNIFFENKDIFMKKINYFCKNRASYRELGVPYSLGIILYGAPGTGKTSCIKALANHTGRSIVDLNLSRIKTYKELKAAFLDVKINNQEVSPDKRIYVFEEFDCIIEKVKQRTNTDTKPHSQNQNLQLLEEIYEVNPYKEKEIPGDAPITIETLLNCIDGTLESNGHIICLTTNFIDKIDKALIRPGRFDCHIHLDNSTPKVILQMIKNHKIYIILKIH
jgi:SpoVK/Ycf46/Vps4 family AAA+-type ATPase